MDLHHFLSQYSYFALLLGAFAEGESVVILAGVLANQGYMHPALAALVAFAGNVTSDQLMFFLGRFKGPALFRRFPRFKSKVDAIGTRIRHHEVLLIMTFRFIYGVRNVTPFFLGNCGTRPGLFLPLNLLGGMIWAATFIAVGYYSGEVFSKYLGPLQGLEPFLIAAVVSAALALAVLIRHWIRKVRSADAPGPDRPARAGNR